MKGNSDSFVMICLYVDDMLITESSLEVILDTKRMLKQLFDMKDMGVADVILGMKISKTSDGLVLTQSHYVEDILKKYGTSDMALAKVPMLKNQCLEKHFSDPFY